MKRLQLVLAEAGIGSRRACEKLIEDGRISVNNKIVKEQGIKVNCQSDLIKFNGKQIFIKKKKYFIFNKPKGVLCSNKDSRGRKLVIDYFKNQKCRLFTVGRLDYYSEGLIFVTNDGAWAEAVSHPSNEVEKEYIVRINSPLNQDQLMIVSKGITWNNTNYGPIKIKGPKEKNVLKVVLKEGKKRHIRVVLNYVEKRVLNLKRIRVGKVLLGDLPEGKFRHLSDNEVIWSKKIEK